MQKNAQEPKNGQVRVHKLIIAAESRVNQKIKKEIIKHTKELKMLQFGI